MCQMSFGLCAGQIFHLDVLLFIFSVLCCTQTTFFRLSGSVRVQQHSLPDALSSASRAVRLSAHPVSSAQYSSNVASAAASICVMTDAECLRLMLKPKHLGYC